MVKQKRKEKAVSILTLTLYCSFFQLIVQVVLFLPSARVSGRCPFLKYVQSVKQKFLKFSEQEKEEVSGTSNASSN